jgi:nicotinate-nucleotide adenylyltransferase
MLKVLLNDFLRNSAVGAMVENVIQFMSDVGRTKRIGLFGGTFNPIHNGHLQVAAKVQRGFSLDHILLIPSAIPPHKEMEHVASAEDRLAMIRLAIGDNPAFGVSDVELNRTGPSYTIDTVNYFKKTNPAEATFFFLLGLDAFLEIETWKSFQELFDAISMIVMSRPGIDGIRDSRQLLNRMEKLIRSKISARYRFDPKQTAFVHPQKPSVYLYEVDPYPISSTAIRSLLIQGHAIQSMVPEPVRHYIESKGLYR